MQGQTRQVGRHTLLPQEVLVTTGICERAHLYRYRILALRFQPFDQGISKLMEVLVDEGRRRVEMLQQLAYRLQLHGLLTTVTREQPRFDRQTHFFVIGKEMARAALRQAVQDEGEALNLYSQLCRASQSNAVNAMLDEFAEHRLIQCQVLQEYRQRLQDAE